VATVINYHEGCYNVFVVVYEPAHKGISEILETFEISSGYDKNSLESAKNRASNLRIELNGENPILAIIGSYGNISPSSILSEPYVMRREIPCRMESYTYVESPISYPSGDYYYQYSYETKAEKRIYPSNPDEYLKPLDIVKVMNIKKAVNYFHFAIYLGKGKVCHITSDNQGAKIESWSDFLDGGVGELYRYHLPIPFKK